MQPEKKIIALNGFVTNKGNYLWSGALTLAWKDLRATFIKEDIRIKSNDHDLQKLVENFNKCPFDKSHLSEEAYYIRSGFGQDTVNLINTQVMKKFPEKETDPLSYQLNDLDIISFAYFSKNIKFPYAFTKTNVMFQGKKVKGFKADTLAQKYQVLVSSYKNVDNFLISFTGKQKQDEVFLFKSEERYQSEDIIDMMNKVNEKGFGLEEDDIFQMPNISIKARRKIQSLKYTFLENESWKNCSFTEIQEIIHLEIDNTGVKAESQGGISLCLCSSSSLPKHIILDKPFWIIMREVGKHPYLLAYITQPEDF